MTSIRSSQSSSSRPSNSASVRRSTPAARPTASKPQTTAPSRPTGHSQRDTFQISRANTSARSSSVSPTKVAQATRPVQTPATRMKALRAELAPSATGRAALQYLDKNGVGIRFHKGGGSYFDGKSKSMVIDTTMQRNRAALAVVHETEHARTFLSGKAPDINKLTRPAYQSAMIHGETRATVAEVKTRNELLSAGRSSDKLEPIAPMYQSAYERAGVDYKKGHAGATEDQVRKASEKAGYDRVYRAFQNGEVTTSTTKQPYKEYYGAGWDRQHLD
jgi:hypothetical protein